jgi:hypothetical protein
MCAHLEAILSAVEEQVREMEEFFGPTVKNGKIS